MKYLFALILLISVTTGSVSGQDQLILVSGDTLSGEIELLMPDKLFEEIYFEGDNGKDRYKAFQFVSFTKDSKEYRTIKFGDKYRIMEVKTDGYLSLLRFRTDESYTFNSLFIHKRGGDGIEVPNFLFKKSMSNFLGDCGQVREALVAGNYRKKDIDQLIIDYNNCMEEQTENRITQYEQKQREENVSPLIDEASTISKQAKQLNDKELSNMLDDVINKLKAGESVPNYLKNALNDYVSDGHQLKQAVNTLVGQL